MTDIDLTPRAKRKLLISTLKLLLGWGITLDDIVAEGRKLEEQTAK